MARLFRPERIEYDILTAHPGSGGAPYWATAAVDAVESHPLSGIGLLKDYALTVVPRLQDFAVHAAPARPEPVADRCSMTPTSASAR